MTSQPFSRQATGRAPVEHHAPPPIPGLAPRADRPLPAEPPCRGKPGKHDAIVHAATVIFLRDGFTNASVDAIAAEAGVAKQTIYNHFRDKEDLFVSVMRAAQHRLGSELELSAFADWLGASDDLGRDLRAFGRESIRRLLRDDIVALRNLIMAERDRHPQLLREWARPRVGLELALARAIGIQAKRGRLDAPDPVLAARQLTMVLFNEATMRSLYASQRLGDPDIEEIVDAGVAMWLRCYQHSVASAPDA